MQREVFTADHEAFRDTVAKFMEKEAVPHAARWAEAGVVDREAWLVAGRQGLLGMAVPEEYGGAGQPDFRFNAVLDEELTRVGGSGLGIPVHNDIVLPYLLTLGTDEQKRRWLPGMCTGETIGAIAMSEPGTGSDLASITTSAVRDGDDWILTGQKTFISNGILADLVIVVARTDPDVRHQGISLFVVERDMPGFSRGRNLDKIGQKAQDTAELFFDGVRLPAGNLLGEEGQGFVYLMQNLPQERLAIAVGAAAACEKILDLTLDYVRQRTAFGRPIGRFQHNRFLLAELHTETTIARVFTDRCIAAHVAGELTVADAAMAKYWTTELQNKVADRCLQLHGGYGYMREYPIAHAWLDSRVQTIYGGTTEIMKEIIGRSLDL